MPLDNPKICEYCGQPIDPLRDSSVSEWGKFHWHTPCWNQMVAEQREEQGDEDEEFGQPC